MTLKTMTNCCAAVGLSLTMLLTCGFTALPIEKVANTSRTDSMPADGKGGWLDLGSNDLRDLPAGEAKYADVRFVVPPAGDETAKNCLVLGRKGAETVTLTLDAPVAGKSLCLLHACAGGPAPESRTEIGKVILRLDDGTTSESPVCVGNDVTDWTSGRSFANAARAWTEYNHNTQVSLFASQFALKSGKKLTAVTFAANGRCPWMIEAATVSDKTKLKPIRSSVEPTGVYKSPEPPSKPLARAPLGQKPKNVILIIGDGMGQGSAQLASYYKYGAPDSVYFQRLPVVGLCSTIPANAPVTDSAAAATAFSTGTKTSNGTLGLQVDDQHDREHPVRLTSVAARAHAKGLGVGILTSDPLYGATPSGSYAHVLSRGESAKICEQASECGYDLLVGSASTENWYRPEEKGGKRKDGRDLVAEMEGRGYAFVRTAADLAAAPKSAKILGALKTFGPEESIGEAMKAAIGRLDRKEGFFMMAECTETDHANHGNDSSKAIKAISMVEFMTAAAVAFAQERGDTLVIVSADHDTGHPSVIKCAGADGRLVVQWTDTSHTRYPVPLHAYGPGAELFEGILDNTDIAKNIARLLNLPE